MCSSLRSPRFIFLISFAVASKERWTLAASVLGSGAVFLEGSVVSVAIPAIGSDLGLGIAGLQWVMNGYLLTLSALMLFGGALGDRASRSRVFAIGLVGFAVSSVGCAIAPNITLLVTARIIQGFAGALVVPNSLAILETTFHGEARVMPSEGELPGPAYRQRLVHWPGLLSFH